MIIIVSTVVLLILLAGYLQRFNRKRHIILMSSAFVIDLGLVLIIELQRHAVEKVVAQQVSSLTLFHAGISLVVLLLYVTMIYLGRGIVLGKPYAREHHRMVSTVFIAFRLTNYVTSLLI